MMTALIVYDAHLTTMAGAGMLCDVCLKRPWTQVARWCHALICEGCAEGEEDPEPTDAAYVAWAKEEYVCEDIEIDPDTRVSRSETGAWVLAWVHVYNRHGDEG
jgi:hypothetical protein